MMEFRRPEVTKEVECGLQTMTSYNTNNSAVISKINRGREKK